MPDIQILTGGQRRTPVELVTGRNADPIRLLGIQPNVEHATLALGNTHLALPEWSVRNGGPMVFQINGNVGGSNLTGMGEPVAVTVTEYAILLAFIVLIATTTTITTTADDPASPVGSRFAAAVEITPGLAQMFVCSSVSGVKKWYPVGYAPSSP